MDFFNRGRAEDAVYFPLDSDDEDSAFEAEDAAGVDDIVAEEVNVDDIAAEEVNVDDIAAEEKRTMELMETVDMSENRIQVIVLSSDSSDSSIEVLDLVDSHSDLIRATFSQPIEPSFIVDGEEPIDQVASSSNVLYKTVDREIPKRPVHQVTVQFCERHTSGSPVRVCTMSSTESVFRAYCKSLKITSLSDRVLIFGKRRVFQSSTPASLTAADPSEPTNLSIDVWRQSEWTRKEQEDRRLRSMVLAFGSEPAEEDADFLLTASNSDVSEQVDGLDAAMTFSVHVKGLATGPIPCTVKKIRPSVDGLSLQWQLRFDGDCLHWNQTAPADMEDGDQLELI